MDEEVLSLILFYFASFFDKRLSNHILFVSVAMIPISGGSMTFEVN